MKIFSWIILGKSILTGIISSYLSKYGLIGFLGGFVGGYIGLTIQKYFKERKKTI
jgi:hypothetical protein